MTKVYAPQNDHVPSEDVLHLFNLDRSGQPLMPRLQLLNWTTGRVFLPWLHHLLSPSLTDVHLDLNGGRSSPVDIAVIKAVPTTHLKHIALSTLRTTAGVNAALLDLIYESKRLKSIYIQQEATVEESSPPHDEVKDEGEPIELGGLTSITIGLKNDSTFLSSLFNRTTLPNIQQIYIKHTGRAEWLGSDNMFDSMLQSASPGVLHALRYTSLYHGIDITSAKIQQLQRFSALRAVRITSTCNASRCKFFLSDNDITTLAVAMPNLTELHLGGTPCASTLVNVSMNGLAVLAANCTKLGELQIHFDTAGFINKVLDGSTEHIPSPQLVPNPCQLTQLNVGQIPLTKNTDGHWTIAMALLQIFPNLKCVKHYQPPFRMGDWGEVVRIIKAQRRIASLMGGTSHESTPGHISDTKLVWFARVIAQEYLTFAGSHFWTTVPLRVLRSNKMTQSSVDRSTRCVLAQDPRLGSQFIAVSVEK